jgi:hypothetical protein
MWHINFQYTDSHDGQKTLKRHRFTLSAAKLFGKGKVTHHAKQAYEEGQDLSAQDAQILLVLKLHIRVPAILQLRRILGRTGSFLPVHSIFVAQGHFTPACTNFPRRN